MKWEIELFEIELIITINLIFFIRKAKLFNKINSRRHLHKLALISAHLFLYVACTIFSHKSCDLHSEALSSSCHLFYFFNTEANLVSHFFSNLKILYHSYPLIIDFLSLALNLCYSYDAIWLWFHSKSSSLNAPL